MNPLTQFKKIQILPVLIALALLALASPTVARANAVTDWNQIASDTLVAFPGPAGGAPSALQLNMGMTQGAVYDALNAIEPRYQPYLLEERFDPGASKEAATATAAYRVLSNIVSTVPDSIPFPNKQQLLDTLATEYTNSLDGIPDGPPKDHGIDAGNAAAAAMIAARQDDGRFTPSPWVPNYEPGHWQPLLDANGRPILDPTAWVANVRPFLIQSSSQFRTDGPNALTSTAYAEDFNEVKVLGSVNSQTRTPEQTHIALFWGQNAGGPALIWNRLARSLVGQYAIDLGDSAFLFATMNLSAADAVINCWNDKYYWDFWRPWAAIQRADEDGNPDTEADPTWTALLTAPYPEHPSGHLSLDGAVVEVLQMFFGDRTAFDVTSTRFPGEVLHFDRFSLALREIIDARILAGLHFRTADVQGAVLGRKVADYMARHYFQPLDSDRGRPR
ncbi:MAG TPA: vanadium-dependent haloperoxidase [Verrucomicrobiae bacterium]|nr:vanadium-dependent haloperoxidase [Verrucomicrobiae bacterium]